MSFEFDVSGYEKSAGRRAALWGRRPESPNVKKRWTRCTSPDFSPRVWKGGASAPPLQVLPEYSSVPRPAQLAAASCAERGTEGYGDRDSGGAEAPPFQ
jgi:hypothetical protein